MTDPRDFTYSVVIPVYNSAGVVRTTVEHVIATLEEHGLSYELILVNDGSSDNSWEIIADCARTYETVVAIGFLANYGQHNANLAGLRESTGDYVITMDDDMQNPPDQVPVLIDKAMAGYDVVFGKFDSKQAPGYRRLGTKLIGLINRRVFAQPADLTVSNFRILRRDVVDRICDSNSVYPYITGQALMYSSNRANAVVRHAPRTVGQSGYSTLRILRLVLTILFSYSLFPLRLAASIGFLVAFFGFVLGAYYLVTGIVDHSRVPGWTSLVVLTALFNGVTITLLSMLGEYVVRTLNTVSSRRTYHIREKVGR